MTDTRAQTYRRSHAELTRHQKTAKGAPAYSRFVNRPLGRHLAAAAHALGATPNQVTAVSAGFSLIGILLLALVPPGPLMAVLACLALVLGYALDSADGQLARLRGGGAPSGEWLDHVVDAAKTVSVHAAVLISFFRFGPDGAALLLPLGYLCLASTWFFTVVLTDLLRRLHREPGATRTAAPAPLWRSLAALPTDYGVLCLVFVLYGWRPVFVTVYAVMLLGTALFFGAALRAWFTELRALGAR